MSTSFIVALEIAKLVFFVAYVSATIGVIVGVYWEGDQFPKAKQEFGWRVLIVSLAFDTLFTVLVFGADGWISAIQRGEIIALEHRLAARKLTDAQISEIEQNLSKYRGQRFELAAYNVKEVSDIAEQIRDALIGAGWKRDPMPANAALRSVVGGVSVTLDVGAPEVAKAAAHQLVTLLNGDDIAADENQRNIPTDTTEEKAVIGIAVGMKP
jgi:hypothetical protein